MLDSCLCGMQRYRERGARDYLHHYVVERGDDVAVKNMLDIFGLQSKTLEPAVLDDFKYHFKAGHGGYPLVGTPEQIVLDIKRLSQMGVDGILSVSYTHLTLPTKA